MMAAEHPYLINLDVRFDPLDLIDARAPAEACKDPRYNQTLYRVNDNIVRLGVFTATSTGTSMTE
jgi:hypothetical protein